jgi:hypothetical protein
MQKANKDPVHTHNKFTKAQPKLAVLFFASFVAGAWMVYRWSIDTP